MDLTKRQQEILFLILKDYIASAEPVGSVQVARKKEIGLSSATVRHVMAELEDLGFLRRAHASSGGIPTDQAYRYYVDRLLDPSPVSATEKTQVRQELQKGGRVLDAVVREACHFISNRVGQPGVALAPPPDERSLRQVQFLLLPKNTVIGVLVFSTGVVETKVLQLDRPMKQRELERIQNYLNEKLAGKTVAQVRKEIFLEMKQAQNRYDDLLNRALLLSEQAFSDGYPHVHIEGQSYLCADPEFADLNTMQRILRALEEKTEMIKILDQSLQSPGIHIFIGEELSLPDLQGMSLVTSVYNDRDGTKGLLGVLGPTRMNYSRIIPLLDFTSQIVTQVLHEETKS